jgi:hypothetical protein
LRNGVVANTLNSIPIWVGGPDGTTGQITYKQLTEAYWNCVSTPGGGSLIGLCNKALFSYLQERQEAKQRYSLERDVTIGFDGFKINGSWVFMDKLCPSTKYGQILPPGLSQTTSIQPSTFPVPTLTAAQTAISNFPTTAVTINPGEPFFWIDVSGWKLRPAEDPEYNFNFTPPIRSQTNPDLVVSFLKAAINAYTVAPRNNSQLIGAGF